MPWFGSAEMEKGEKLDELLGEMERLRRNMDKLEELLRRWNASGEGESLDKRERSGREGGKRRKKIEEKVDKGEVEKSWKRKMEERSDREKGEEEKITRKEYDNYARRLERLRDRRQNGSRVERMERVERTERVG